MRNGFGFVWPDWAPDVEDVVSALDLGKQGLRIFVPGIGIVEGAIEAARTGSPTGAAKFFVPGLGMVEGAVEGTADFFRLAGQPTQDAAQNAAMSTATLLLLLGAFGVVALVIWKK